MGFNPQHLRENISQIGIKEAKVHLKRWINNSNNPELRREALQLYGEIEQGKDYKFLEEIFLSDESVKLRLLSGKILGHNYFQHKKVIKLLEYVLNSEEEIYIKFLALELLDKFNLKKCHTIIHTFLEKMVEKIDENQRKNTTSLLSIMEQKPEDRRLILEICDNLILFNHYKEEFGYNVTLREGIIILLNCEGSNITHISDIPGIEKLVDLEHLILKRNRISKIEGLEILKKLKYLNLTNNDIEKIENLSHLRKLEDLILSENKISKVENISLPHLKKLFLDKNLISEIGDLDVALFLEEINLSSNQIKRITNLEKLKSLKTLNLSNNNIQRISGLDNLQNLISLNLNKNKVPKIEDLAHLVNLKILNLSNNEISKLENLENLQSLSHLEISKNQISKIEGLDNLINLQELFLDKNQINKIEGLNNLKSLIILFLERNNITNFDLKDIEHLENLNFIFLNENPLDIESKEKYETQTRFP
jgi:Leucine-rich repeat (LRR) protein